jgi:hypothetical protein
VCGAFHGDERCHLRGETSGRSPDHVRVFRPPLLFPSFYCLYVHLTYVHLCAFCLPICMSVHLPYVYLCFRLPLYLSIYAEMNAVIFEGKLPPALLITYRPPIFLPSTHAPTVCLSVYLSARLSSYIPSIYFLSVYLPIELSIYGTC